jgi:hypothetical protein
LCTRWWQQQPNRSLALTKTTLAPLFLALRHAKARNKQQQQQEQQQQQQQQQQRKTLNSGPCCLSRDKANNATATGK